MKIGIWGVENGYDVSMLNLLLGRRCRNILVRPRGEDLQQIAQMMADDKLRPTVQEVYTLEEAAAAHRVSEAGHVRGKLVLSISGASIV